MNSILRSECLHTHPVYTTHCNKSPPTPAAILSKRWLMDTPSSLSHLTGAVPTSTAARAGCLLNATRRSGRPSLFGSPACLWHARQVITPRAHMTAAAASASPRGAAPPPWHTGGAVRASYATQAVARECPLRYFEVAARPRRSCGIRDIRDTIRGYTLSRGIGLAI